MYNVILFEEKESLYPLIQYLIKQSFFLFCHFSPYADHCIPIFSFVIVRLNTVGYKRKTFYTLYSIQSHQTYDSSILVNVL